MNASIQSSLRVMYDNLGPAEFFAELREFLSDMQQEETHTGVAYHLHLVGVSAEVAQEYCRGGVAAGEEGGR